LLEVDDLVSAIELTLKLPVEKVNDTFNVGAKVYKTVNEDVGALCEYARSGSKPLPIPASIAIPFLELFWILKVSPLYKWVYGTAHKESFVSIEKIEKTLGWKPKFSNADALIHSYQWYLEHKHEIDLSGGVTHRAPWKQGVLSLIKKFM